MKKITEIDNLEFTPEYFEPEIREGIFISSMMKRVWAVQIQVLLEVDKVCRRHNIRWFADNGTLLGSVRHHGFIPWDDDLDICMLRKDYEELLKYTDELPEGFYVMNIHTDPTDTDMLTRVTNTQEIRFDDEFLGNFCQCPFAIGVDIFPLEYLSPDPEAEEARRDALNAIIYLIEFIKANGDEALEVKASIAEAMSWKNMIYDESKSSINQLHLLAEEFYKEYPGDDSDEVVLMPYFIAHHNHVYKKKWYDKEIFLPFENVLVPCSPYYDDVLQVEYGNWQPVYRNGGIHDFPFYTKQEAVLEEKLHHNAFRYTGTPMEHKRFESIKLSSRIMKEPSISDRHSVLLMPQSDIDENTLCSMLSSREDLKNSDIYLCLLPYGNMEAENRNEVRIHDLSPETNEVLSSFASSNNSAIINLNWQILADSINKGEAKYYFDEIIEFFAYDTTNITLSLINTFRTENLIKHTSHLVFAVPNLHTPTEIEGKLIAGMRDIIESPAALGADEISVCSDGLKEIFANRLSELTHEDKEKMAEKITVRDDELNDFAEKCDVTSDKYAANTSDSATLSNSDGNGIATDPKETPLVECSNTSLLIQFSVNSVLDFGSRVYEKALDEINKAENGVIYLAWSDEEYSALEKAASNETVTAQHKFEEKIVLLSNEDDSKINIIKPDADGIFPKDIYENASSYSGTRSFLAHEADVYGKQKEIWSFD